MSDNTGKPDKKSSPAASCHNSAKSKKGKGQDELLTLQEEAKQLTVQLQETEAELIHLKDIYQKHYPQRHHSSKDDKKNQDNVSEACPTRRDASTIVMNQEESYFLKMEGARQRVRDLRKKIQATQKEVQYYRELCLMHCPKCGTRLEELQLAEDLVLDQCPSCKGVWCDEGELQEAMLKKAKKLNDPGVLAKITSFFTGIENK